MEQKKNTHILTPLLKYALLVYAEVIKAWQYMSLNL